MLMLLIALLITANDQRDDLEAMQGTWVLVSTGNGLPGQKEFRLTDRSFKLVVKGNTIRAFQRDRSGKAFTFTVDSSKNPKQIDTLGPDGEHLKGIYELDGNTMKSSFSPPGRDRPTSFNTTSTSINAYEREKRRP
jgi:uncharacterized protein (TIGR03067 family)